MTLAQIRFRRGTTSEWNLYNPILADGEPGWDRTLDQVKVGDGVTHWIDLPYQSVDMEQLTEVAAEAAASAAAALVAQEAAEAAQETAQAAANTTDEITEGLIEDHDSASYIALQKTFAPNAALGPNIRRPKRSKVTVISRLQTGHGFTGSGAGATFDLNHTGSNVLGTQSVKMTTPGNGVAAKVAKTGLTAFNPTGKNFIIYLKVDDPTKLASVILYVGDTALANFKTISLKSPNGQWWGQAGEWFALGFSLTPATTTGTPSATAVTDVQLYVTDKSTGAVNVWWNGLDLVDRDTVNWPNGVVSFSYDDTYLAQFTEARKALDKYAFPATLYTIIDRVDAAGGLTLAQLRQLQDINGWDVAFHANTTARHNLTNGYVDLTADQLDEEFRLGKAWLISNGFRAADHFAYPKGRWDLATEAVVREYAATARMTSFLPHDTLPPVTPLRRRSYQVIQSTTTAEVLAEVDKAYAAGDWLDLCFHNLVTTPAQDTEYSITNHQTIVDGVNTKGIPVRTVSDIYASQTV